METAVSLNSVIMGIIFPLRPNKITNKYCEQINKFQAVFIALSVILPYFDFVRKYKSRL